MHSLDETFAALTAHLRHPESPNPAKSDPFSILFTIRRKR
jgi:hypothetical protein